MQVSFKNEIVPLFNSTNGNGAWFNYGNGGETYGPAFACGVYYAGWLAGVDGGMMALLGESAVGMPDYNWSKSMLKMRLRNSRWFEETP